MDQDFLSNRSQAVVVDEMKLDTIPVKSGVPQANINDLPGHITSYARILVVADDTVVDRKINL